MASQNTMTEPFITGLAPEEMDLIAEHLDLRDLAAMAMTCKGAQEYFSDRLYKRDYQERRSALLEGCRLDNGLTISQILVYYPNKLNPLNHQFDMSLGRCSFMTPLTVSVEHFSFGVVQQLIQNGADVNQPEGTNVARYGLAAESRWSPIHYAVGSTRQKNLEQKHSVLSTLLDSGANPNQLSLPHRYRNVSYDFLSLTPLWLAVYTEAQSDQPDLISIRILLSRGADPNIPCIEGRHFYDRTKTLNQITAETDTEIEARLHGIVKNETVLDIDGTLQTPLSYLIITNKLTAGKLKIALELIQSGKLRDDMSEDLIRCLEEPKQQQQWVKLVDSLLENGADPRCRSMEVPVVLSFLRRHVNWDPIVIPYYKDRVLPKDRFVELEKACKISLDMIDVLMRYGANIHAVDFSASGTRETAVHIAAGLGSGWDNLVRGILDRKPNTKAVTTDGKTAFHKMFWKDNCPNTLMNPGRIGLLKSSGCPINAIDAEGNTAFHYFFVSSMAKNKEWMREMLRNGGDPTILNKLGQDPEGFLRAYRKVCSIGKSDSKEQWEYHEVSKAMEALKEAQRELAEEDAERRKRASRRNNYSRFNSGSNNNSNGRNGNFNGRGNVNFNDRNNGHSNGRNTNGNSNGRSNNQCDVRSTNNQLDPIDWTNGAQFESPNYSSAPSEWNEPPSSTGYFW